MGNVFSILEIISISESSLHHRVDYFIGSECCRVMHTNQ